MVLPCLMSAFNSIGGSCFGWIGERISTEAAHLIAYADNIENLKKQVKNLSDTIESLQHRIEDAANNQGATLVDPVVKTLLERMASVKEDSSKLIRDEEQSSDSTCLMGLRPNLLSCYRISKSAKKAIDDATGLLEEEKKYDRPVANVDYSLCLGVTPNSEFEELESRVLASHLVVEALKDPNVHKVGVYGMGGTGKTTLAVKIGADLQLNGTFSYVVLAVVSEKLSLLQSNYQSDLSSIQKQIAEGLKIQLEGETLNARATQLRDQLQKRNKLLIILDDIWSKFEFEMVGIPVDSKFTSKFKILMTSRSKIVLENEMDSKKNFGLDSLSTNDAQNLFDKMIGGNAHYSNWPLVASEVVNSCGGIPILLVTIAKALRNATQSIWEDALTQLKRFNGKDIDEEGYKRIEVSYNFLKNEELKKLFLLCAQLNHRSIGFEELLRYAMGLDLFEGRETIKEVSGRLHKYLRDLKGCCLLQDGNTEGMIKMHDVVHKFASGDPGVFSVANDDELKRWPSKEQFGKYRAISFFYCGLPSDHKLPVAFNPNLESFLMLRSEIDASIQIPESFFAGLKGLKVMNLTRMSLSPVLVSSLSALEKLRTLCLDHCKLSDITVIGELPMLQALSLVGSSIVFFPKEMGQLGGSLKLLDLRDCLELKRIAYGVISRLTLMEDLRIGESFRTWQRLKGGNHKTTDTVDETNEVEMASMKEFKNLHNLINLEIHVGEHAKMFPKDLVFRKLEAFKISFGDREMSKSEYISRKLEVHEYSPSVDFHSEGTKALMTRAESLILAGVMSSESVSEMDLKGFQELKHLQVKVGNSDEDLLQYNDSRDGPEALELKYIVKKNYNDCIFRKLETLGLFFLRRLERICDDHSLLVGSFGNLRVLHACQCELLNHIFSSNLARSLLRLQEIIVMECDSMESIIISRERESENEEIQMGFRVLELYKLPRLLSFYNFKHIEEGALPSPTPLFNEKVIFPKLEILELSFLKIEKIWDVDHLEEGTTTCWFQNLTRLTVFDCHNLSYLFTSSMVKSLAKLEQLEVRYCKSIEKIVATTEEDMDADRLLFFPKLESLELRSLPKLKRFCHANLPECPSLQTLKIIQCLLLVLDEKIVFPKLEVLELSHMKNEIWDVEETTTYWFQNLTSLKVFVCHNMSYLFTSSMVKSLAQLKQLEVSRCKSIEEIVGTTGDVQLSFPKLDNIKLEYLPKLKRFCQANLVQCQLLRKLAIRGCSNLKTFVIHAANDDSSSDNNSTTALLTEKVAFPNVEELQITDCDSIEKLFDIQILLPMNECRRILPFKNLRSVDVSYCPSLTSIFPTYLVLTSLQQLERLQVKKCDKIEWFGFNNTQQQLNDAFAKLISSLKSCHLDVGGDLSLEYACQKLKLKIVDCGLQFPSILSALLKFFPKLDEVEVSSNSTITELFPCEPHHLVAADGHYQVTTLARIVHLKLTEFSNMKHVWSENSPLKYHEILEVLEVAKCDSLVSLAPPSTTLFKNLTGLEVYRCVNLKYLFTSSMVKSLAKLKQLEVRNCDSIEEIVVSMETEDVLLSFLKIDNIKLKDLPKLKRFCEANSLDCQLLSKLVIQGCPELQTFVSVAANDDSSSDNNSTTLFTEEVEFPNMKELQITNCHSLKKVFDIQILPMDEHKTLPFQKLQSVDVSYCASLTSIFPACLVLTSLQQLERLKVKYCDKIDLLDFNNTQQQFNDAFTKLISSLDYFYLKSIRFLKLKKEKQSVTLKILECGSRVPPVLFPLLKIFPKLHKVEVSSSSTTTHIFPCESDHLATADGDDMGTTQVPTPVRIRNLKLSRLSNMKQIWIEHSPMKYHVLPEDLKVIECDNLLSLAPSSTALFKNLTGLVVWDCCKLMKLVSSSSTAKSLVNLKNMTVRECHSLEEIVGIDDQELANNDEHIVFEKLNILHLEDMNSLTSFCSGSHCNFRFPSLNRVVVLNCPKMKFFSEGALSTPNLIKVQDKYWVEENEWRWEGDLNSTVRKIFEEKDDDDDVDDDNDDDDGDDNEDDDEEVCVGEAEEEEKEDE